ncbi:MAG: hypothetical protein JW839_20175 [Candidatus Lokiarchaeota archaeon]|nr:hypothetical protein [Candidatus Lokiarchaeota archaeon]
MDLPLEPIPIPRAQRERIAKAVKQRIQEGREEHEKYVQELKKQGYSEAEIEAILD